MGTPWKHAEHRAAKVLGGKRHVRTSRLESAPDVEAVPDLSIEVKWRAALPRLVVESLKQAARYAKAGQTPCAVLYQKRSRKGIVCVYADDFAKMRGEKVSPPAEGNDA